jgi:transcriptional regulator with XRE-family HTH domain
MSATVDTQRLAALVRAKRGKHGLRETAKAIGGLSASTLSRIEQGNVPDLDTFLRLCAWLNVAPADLAPALGNADTARSAVPSSPTEAIEFHLRADRTLPPATAEALITMVRLAFEQAKQGTATSDE